MSLTRVRTAKHDPIELPGYQRQAYSCGCIWGFFARDLRMYRRFALVGYRKNIGCMGQVDLLVEIRLLSEDKETSSPIDPTIIQHLARCMGKADDVKVIYGRAFVQGTANISHSEMPFSTLCDRSLAYRMIREYGDQLVVMAMRPDTIKSILDANRFLELTRKVQAFICEVNGGWGSITYSIKSLNDTIERQKHQLEECDRRDRDEMTKVEDAIEVLRGYGIEYSMDDDSDKGDA